VVWVRWRSGRPIDTPFTTTLTLMASGAGTAIVAGALPLWVVVMRGIHGGTIDSNLPPGTSEDALLGLVVLGALITIVRAISSSSRSSEPSAAHRPHQIVRPTAVVPRVVVKSGRVVSS